MNYQNERREWEVCKSKARPQSIDQSMLISIQKYLKPIIGPRSEFHNTGLFVEWEIFDVDFAWRLVNGRRFPLDQAIPPQGGLGCQGHLEIAIGARIIRLSKLVKTLPENVHNVHHFIYNAQLQVQNIYRVHVLWQESWSNSAKIDVPITWEYF